MKDADKTVRKLIDLPIETVKKLQDKADKEGRKLKNYIERILIKEGNKK